MGAAPLFACSRLVASFNTSLALSTYVTDGSFVVQEGDYLSPPHRWKAFEIILYGIAGLQVIHQGLHRHAGLGEDRRPAHHLGVDADNLVKGHLYIHGM